MGLISAAILLLAASVAPCQTPSKESDALQALVGEMRQLRQAIESQTLVSQRVQIALYTLQMQDAAVARDAQSADDVKKKCRTIEDERQHMEARVHEVENALAAGTAAEVEMKEFRSRLPEIKNEVEAHANALRTCQTAESDATVQLRKDQARLNELRDRIELIDKGLANLASPK